MAVIQQAQGWRETLEKRARTWVAKQPPPLEVLLVGVGSSAQGAVLGGVMGQLTKMMETQAANTPGMPPINQARDDSDLPMCKPER